ncbi:MAG: tyrosine-protein phosphatase [Oscillospiraceae bacterium]|nr:tyrosine-protein phosphatase [Oscillospiraceae bacterium]
MKKRLSLTLLLVLLLSACLLPQAFAAETDAESTNQDYATVEANIYQINKYGNILLTIGADSLRKLGYEPGDIVLVRIGDSEMEMPIGTAYTDADSGEPLCCFRTANDGTEVISLGINAGNLASTMGVAKIRTIKATPGYEVVWADGLDSSVSVSVSMAEKQGYADELRMHQTGLVRSNNREDYAQLDDEAYANFRAVNTTGMGTDTLFRSSSPIDPALNRSAEADEALLKALVRTVVNMADTQEQMEKYADYGLTHYSQCDIIALSMGMDFQGEAFREKIAEGCRFMLSHDGPYLIHCIEGKDRTGFLCALLECLMGADADEVVADYMQTYLNFYGLEPGTEQYATIVSSTFDPILSRAFGIDSIYEDDIDLADCAEEYLTGLGLMADEITTLRQKLSENYGGLINAG